MKLFTFAHFAEAKSFIEHFNLERSLDQDWIFTSSDLILILTGEGPQSSLSRTSFTLGRFANIHEVINFGIAGSLNTDLNLLEIYPVRHVYAFFDSPLFHSYVVSVEGLDIVTTYHRILKPEQLPPLKTMAKLVDRELWGVARAACDFHIPIRAFKLISDVAGTLSACEIAKENASLYSDKLLNFSLTLKDDIKSPQNNFFVFPHGLYLTTTQERQFLDLKKKLHFYYSNLEIETFISEASMGLIEAVKLPKDRTRKLLDMMRDKLCPHSSEFNHV